jgi:hypothetical protein
MIATNADADELEVEIYNNRRKIKIVPNPSYKKQKLKNSYHFIFCLLQLLCMHQNK